jgi:hypothetical protein
LALLTVEVGVEGFPERTRLALEDAWTALLADAVETLGREGGMIGMSIREIVSRV